MVYRANINRLARNLKTSLPPNVPRNPYPTFHVGWLDDVDNGRNVGSFAWNDPSGEITAGIPIAMSYTPTHLPEAGHLVQLMVHGNIAQITSRIIVPDGFIVVP